MCARERECLLAQEKMIVNGGDAADLVVVADYIATKNPMPSD